MRFEEIISPVSIDVFKGSVRDRQPYTLWRSSSNLEELFGWSDLNNVLHQQKDNEVDVAFLRHNQRISLRDTSNSVDRKFQKVNQLDGKKITEIFKSGGTVRISKIDEKSASLESVAVDMEQILGCWVDMAMFAGFGPAHYALPPHFDRHDVLILQTEGRKKWEIFGFGDNPYPISPPSNGAVDCPTQLIWTGELEQGDILFIPRGSWHRASVVSDSPTLQISIAMHHIMLHELSVWLADKLSGHPINNRHLLDWSSTEDSSFEEEIRQALSIALEPGFLGEYRSNRKQTFPRRFDLELPI